MVKLYILYDCPLHNNDKKWLGDGLRNSVQDINEIGTFCVLSQLLITGGVMNRIKQIILIIKQCITVSLQTGKDDYIICWSELTGLIMNSITLLGKRRKVVLLNWLSPPETKKKTIGRWFLNRLRKSAVMNPMCKIVTNAPSSTEKWIDYLKVNNKSRFYYIPDVYNSNIPFEKIVIKSKKYCFAGGMNNRDWGLLTKVAEELSNIDFICVALKSDWDLYVSKLPDNVTVYFNTSEEEYYNYMKNSYVVLLPLRTKRVSGLINVMRAAQYGVLCCASDTEAVRLYYSQEQRDLLLNGFQEWKDKIKEIYEYTEEKYIQRAGLFQSNIRNLAGPNHYCERLVDIIYDNDE